MTRQVTDQLYIEIDYFTPEEYYVYQAESVSAQSSESTVDAVVGKLYDVTVTCDALFEPNFQVEAIKNSFAVLDATTELTAQAEAIRDFNSQLDSSFEQNSVVERIRELVAILNVESSVTVDGTVSGAVEGYGTWESNFTIDVAVELYKDVLSNMISSSTITVDSERIRFADSSQLVEFAQTSDNTRIRDVDSTTQAEFTSSALIGKIVQGNCAIDALFTPSMTADVVKNTFAVLDSTAALAVVANANRSAQVALSSIINQSLQGDRIRDYAVNANSQFTQTVDYTKIISATVTISAQASITDTSTRVRYATANIAGDFSPTITANLTKQGQISLNASFSATSSAVLIKTTGSSLVAQFAVTANGDEGTAQQFFINGLALSGSNLIGLASASDSLGNVYFIAVKQNSTGAVLGKFSGRGRLQWVRNLNYSTPIENAKLIYHDGNLYGLIGYSENITSILPTNPTITINRSKLFKFDPVNISMTWTKTSGYFRNSYSDSFDAWSYPDNLVSTGAVIERYFYLTDFEIYNNEIYVVGYSRKRAYRSSYPNIDLPLKIQGKVDLSGSEVWYKLNEYRPLYTSVGDFTIDIPSFLLPKVEVTSSGLLYNSNFTGTAVLDVDRSFTATSNLSGSNLYSYRATTAIPTIPGDVLWLSSGTSFVSIEVLSTKIEVKVVPISGGSFTGFSIPVSSTSYAHNCVIDSNDNIYLTYMNSSNRAVVVKCTTSSITWAREFYVSSGDSLKIERISLDETENYFTLAGIWTKSTVNYSVLLQSKTDGSDSLISVNKPSTPSGTINWGSVSITTTNIFGSVTRTAIVDGYSAANSSSAWSRNDIKLFATTINGTVTDLTTQQTVGTSSATALNILLLVYSGTANFTSAFTTTANNRRVRISSVALTNTFTSTVSAIRTARTPAQLICIASVVPNGGYIKGTSANLATQASVQASLGLIKRHEAALAANFTQTANISKFVGFSATLTSEFAQTANNSRTRDTDSTITAMASNLTAINKIGRGLIQCDVVASVDAQPVKTASVSADLTATTAQTTVVKKITTTSSSMPVKASFNVQFVKIPQTPVVMESEFTQTTETANSKVLATGANLQITSTQTTQAVKTARSQPVLAAITELTFGNQVTRLRLASSSQQLQAELQAPAVKTARTTANFTAFDTVLVTGTKISFDPELQLTIPAEYRTVNVPEENTLLVVPEETRVNMVRMTI